MRILLVTLAPDGEEDDQPIARTLADLGCEVGTVPFADVMNGSFRDAVPFAPPPGGPAPPPAQAVLLDAGDRLEGAYACLKRLRVRPELTGVPALVVVAPSRLASLDFRAADDFVLAPAAPAELYARLRQLDWRLAAFTSDDRIKIGDLLIDLAGYEAHLRDRRLELTHQEFELLRFLAQQRGKVFTRPQLLSKVWGYRHVGGTRTVDIHVRRLRAKLGPGADRLIETVRNVGYKVRAE